MNEEPTPLARMIEERRIERDIVRKWQLYTAGASGLAVGYVVAILATRDLLIAAEFAVFALLPSFIVGAVGRGLCDAEIGKQRAK
jgi:hypothetical protein